MDANRQLVEAESFIPFDFDKIVDWQSKFDSIRFAYNFINFHHYASNQTIQYGHHTFYDRYHFPLVMNVVMASGQNEIGFRLTYDSKTDPGFAERLMLKFIEQLRVR